MRGRAEEVIDPDRLTVHSVMARTGASKRESLSELGAAVERLEGALRAAGAVPGRAANSSASWTWWLRATTTAPEYDTDPTARMRLTGRTSATVTVMSTLTGLAQLDTLASLLDAQEGLHVQTATWAVDAADPAWRRVRTTAIAAAMAKARDDADALGGQLSRLEHIADAGLLGAGDSATVSYSGSYQSAGSHGTRGSPPLLVHLPEELPEQEARAVVIARTCRAHVVFAGFAGPTGDVFTQTAGTSSIWSPDGLAVARAGPTPGGVARATLV